MIECIATIFCSFSRSNCSVQMHDSPGYVQDPKITSKEKKVKQNKKRENHSVFRSQCHRSGAFQTQTIVQNMEAARATAPNKYPGGGRCDLRKEAMLRVIPLL